MVIKCFTIQLDCPECVHVGVCVCVNERERESMRYIKMEVVGLEERE